MKKIYVLDTNVLLSDPKCLDNFEDNDLVIPILVLEELDKHKSRSDEVGRNGREVSRHLDQLRNSGDLRMGVQLRGGGKLRVLSSTEDYKKLLPADLTLGSSVDNMIIGFVRHLENELAQANLPGPILVSKDINVRVKCSSLGIEAQDYLSLRIADNVESLYGGVKVVETEDHLVDGFYAGEKLKVDDVTSEQTYPNEIVILKSIDEEGNTLNSALSRRLADGTLAHLQKFETVFGIRPRNKEQIFSFDLLMDPSIKLLTLTGKAGCGKTAIALAAGLEQLEMIGSQPLYKKLIVSRPVQPVGRDIGFLPGTLEEKMEPWVAPIRDNLEFLLGLSGTSKRLQPSANSRRKKSDDQQGGFRDPYLDLMQQKGLIEIEAISFIRGRSIPNSFIIIDEAQNLSVHELKTIITRAGEGTKIVLTGDVEQIDNVDVDTYTNGLTYAVERFKDYGLAAHITLLKGERSELATLASKIL